MVAPFIVVGQFRKICKVLQPPGIAVSPIADQHTGKLEVHPGKIALVLFIAIGCAKRLFHELERTHAVTFLRVHVLAAAAMLPAFEFAGNDESVVTRIEIVLRHGKDCTPIGLVDHNNLLAELIRFADAIQVLETRHRHVQIIA